MVISVHRHASPANTTSTPSVWPDEMREVRAGCWRAVVNATAMRGSPGAPCAAAVSSDAGSGRFWTSGAGIPAPRRTAERIMRHNGWRGESAHRALDGCESRNREVTAAKLLLGQRPRVSRSLLPSGEGERRSRNQRPDSAAELRPTLETREIVPRSYRYRDMARSPASRSISPSTGGPLPSPARRSRNMRSRP
jgi:hypothetical protein